MPMTKKSLTLTTAALAAVTLGTAAAQTTAHADAATSANPAGVATASSADQQLVNLKHQQVANEYQTEQNNQATMSAATSNANNQIASLNSQIQQRQASNAAAHQAKVASQTAQVNSAASSATAQENAAYSSAVASQAAANSAALTSAQAHIVTEQQKAQQTAQENTAYQSAAGKLATNHKQSLNKIDTNTANQTKDVNDQIAKAQEQIKANHQKALANATKQVDGQIADAQKSVNNAQSNVTSDQNAVNQAKTANDQAQQASQNAQKTLSQDQSNLKSLQASQKDQTTDKLNVPADYINVWKEFAQKYSDWELTKKAHPNLWQRNHDASAQAKKLNDDDHFVASKMDRNTPITFNTDGSLSRKDAIIATQYAAQLINPIRKAIGIKPYRITNASIDIAMENDSKNIANGNSSWNAGHDGNLSTQIAHEWGTDGLGESLAGVDGYYTDKYTVADLKTVVYDAVVMLLFEGADGSDNGHTTDLLGVRYAKEYAMAAEHNIHGFVTLGGSDLLGVTVDFNQKEGTWKARFNSIADGKSPRIQQEQGYNIKAGSAIDKTIQGSNYDQIAVPSDDESSVAKQISQLQTKVANDQAAVNNAKSKADGTAKALKSAQDKLTNDQKALKTAQDKLNSLKSSRDQMIAKLATPEENTAVKKLEAQLADIKTKHDQAVKAENAKYQNDLAKLTKEHQDKLAAIEAQPSDVNDLKAQLQKKLDDLKANHEAKLTKIQNDANAQIAKIKAEAENDPEIAKLQNQIATIKSNLAAQKKTLDDQYAALLAKDQADYQKLVDQLNNSEEAAKGEHNSYQTADGKTIVLRGGNINNGGKITASANHDVVANANVNATAYPDNATSVKSVSTKVEPTTREEVKAQQGKLPQTGNQSTLAAIVLGAASAMFGLGLAAKKRY